jgi:GNAT superfamily N-acetyltransferase
MRGFAASSAVGVAARAVTGGGPTEPLVRSATPRDTAGILALIAASYGREDTPSQLDYWRWKHEQNPFGASPCLVAESAGRLVGVRVFLRWNWQSGDQCVRTARAVDTATRPEWRGRGIFSRLTMRLVEQMQAEGVSFIYNTPNGKSLPGYLKMGWEPATRIPIWIRPVRLSSWLRRTFSSGADAPGVSAFAPAADAIGDARLPAFLADVTPDDARYHTGRTLRYLRWRYADIPSVRYWGRFETAGDAGALVIARDRVRKGLRELTISELLVTPSLRGVQVGRSVVRDLIRDTTADYVAACAAAGTPERSVLARAGFLPVPGIGPQFTTRRLSLAGPMPSQWTSWRCSIGDLELF